jgi:hypothetical protein
MGVKDGPNIVFMRKSYSEHNNTELKRKDI